MSGGIGQWWARQPATGQNVTERTALLLQLSGLACLALFKELTDRCMMLALCCPAVAYLFLLHQMGTALFRLMGALGRELNRTNMFGR